VFFRTFKEARSLAPPFVFSIACARAGIPLLMLAPPSGGKSTVILAVEEWLKGHGESTLKVSRLGLKGLRQLTEWLKSEKRATLLNEDYALIGSSGYMVEKMGELVGALSYSKTYQDFGLRINITVDRLGFISGVQPYWIFDMVTNPVFATHLREKFLRYYMLPCSVTRPISMATAISLLTTSLRERERGAIPKIPSSFMGALELQVGETRALEYAQRLVWELARFIPEGELEQVLDFYSWRLVFDAYAMEREIGERHYEVTSRWHEYTVLYWLLRRGALTREELAKCLGVTHLSSVDRATGKAIRQGWITSYWDSAQKKYIPSLEWKRRLVA